MARSTRKSPILGAVSSMIGEATGTLVTDAGRFRHSFELRLEDIAADPDQARRTFDGPEIEGLAATMAEQGQLQPILVRQDPDARGRWIIIAGERRYRAARHNGWTSILAIEPLGDPEVIALIENLQRVDLSPMEEAGGLQRLIQGKGWTQDEAAETLGKSKADISATLRILSLPEAILAPVLTSEPAVGKHVLVELARVEDPRMLNQLAALAARGRLTVRAIRAARAVAEVPAKRGRPAAEPMVPGRQINVLAKALTDAAKREPKLSAGERAAVLRLREACDRLVRSQDAGG